MPREKERLELHLSQIFRSLKRGPQAMLPKDIGLIIAYSGIGRDSLVVDAGSGSGFLAIALGLVAREVHTYEIREDFFKLASNNVKRAGLQNVAIENRDILAGIPESNVDLVTLDMPNSELAVKHAFNSLKSGGHCVGFLPHVEQVVKFASECRACGFAEVFVVESMVRELLVREAGSRPAGKGLTHTGYLAFARK